MNKKIIGWRWACMVLCFVGPYSALGKTPSFEGEVDYVVFYPTSSCLARYFFQGPKLRIEAEYAEGGGAVTLVADYGEKKIAGSSNKNQSFRTTEVLTSKKLPETDTTFYPSGKKDQILGHDVEEWVLKSPQVQGSLWMAHDMGSFLGFEGILPEAAKKSQLSNQFVTAVNRGLFPLKIRYEETNWDPSKGKAAKTFISMIAQKIIAGKPDSEKFEVQKTPRPAEEDITDQLKNRNAQGNIILQNPDNGPGN